jgi:Zn-dependent peptidase ImmA (M78 family)
MPGKLPRGFKAESERISQRVRRELGLSVSERLRPSALARHLEVRTRSLRRMEEHGYPAEYIAELLSPAADFSAVTVLGGERPLVVYNPDHSPGRRASDVVHELSHILRKHPPRPAIGFGGCREWDDRYEREAEWLAGALLVPRNGAFALIRQGGTMEDGADLFGVTVPLFRWRAHVTGAVRVVGYLRAS